MEIAFEFIRGSSAPSPVPMRQHAHQFGDDGYFGFVFGGEVDGGVVGVEGFEGDAEVAPGGVGGLGLLACVLFYCVALVGFGVEVVEELDEEDFALAGAGDRCGEDAVGAVRDLWLHGVAGHLGDEHALVERVGGVDADPVFPVFVR